jgi:hypothetical protein
MASEMADLRLVQRVRDECGDCRSAFGRNWQLCSHCDVLASNRCPACRMAVPPGAYACGHCGLVVDYRSSMRGQSIGEEALGGTVSRGI